MTAMSAPLPFTVPARRAGHFGLWRAATSVPAMVGSLLLLLVAFGWMGQWEGLVLLGWLASGAAVFTRLGERAAVTIGCGFRALPRAQRTAIEPVWTAALARAELTPGDVDLYVQRSADLNAFAAGGRSVALTSGVLSKFLARRLGTAHLEAILVHELGHHATRATRFALVTMWLATPWRFAARLIIGVGLATVGRRQPKVLLALAAAAVVIGVVQTAQQGQAAAAVVLATVAVCALACPVADAWVSRRSEYAADRFAVQCGVGPQLIDALTRIDSAGGRRLSWTQRALARHPSLDRRVDAMQR